ncbi:hypothetical protein VTP01DRAFT_3911 [Rhizomucor pusillus]|uniref:uncharacterized protein n=1 Tax=Rhizomucor pusillus TaxID=4840 RepID=UPI0037426BF2
MSFRPLLCRSFTTSRQILSRQIEHSGRCRPSFTFHRPSGSSPVALGSQPPRRLFSYTCARQSAEQMHSERHDEPTVKPASIANGLAISDKAVKQLKFIAERDNDNKSMLRILVDSGGCHGYQNKLELTTEVEEDDTIFEKDGVRVVVDPVSLQFIRGSTVDFVEELIGSTFQVVDNPNAKNSCGCNISYDIDLDMITQN